MSKFNVGDRARNVGYPDFGRLGEVGTIIEDDKTSCPYLVRFSDGGCLWLTEAQLEPEHQAESIHITRDGSTVQAVHKRDGEIIQRSTAKCSPSDTFDFAVGADLAYQRLMHPEVKPDKPSKQDKPVEPVKHQYKVEDRVIVNGNVDGKILNGEIGTIKRIMSPSSFWIDFESNIGGWSDWNCHISDGHGWTIPVENLKPYTEPKQTEPVKLYCVKDNGSNGIEVTVGKIYEFDADGYIQYDNLKSTHFDSFKDWKRGDFNVANCLVPLVKRPAKVGEWVYITSDDGCAPGIKIGNIYQVKATAIRAGWVRVLSESFGAVRNDEYLVLDGYQPEPEYEWVDGYKGFDPDLKCRGFQYAVGGIVRLDDGETEAECSKGFHFCKTLEDVYKHYADNGSNRFCRVRGYVKKGYNYTDKYCARALEVIEEVTKPKYWSGKVVCVDSGINSHIYTTGKVYGIKDGVFKSDRGSNPFGDYKIKSFEDLCEQTDSKFIEFKG